MNRHLLLMGLLLTLAKPVLAQSSQAQPLAVSEAAFIALSVNEIDNETAWFETVFGAQTRRTFDLPNDRGKIVLMQAHNLMVELIQLQGSENPVASGPRAQAQGLVKAGLFVNDAEASRAALDAAGILLRGKLFEDPTFNSLSFQIEDPEGNVIQIFQRLIEQ